MGFVPPLIAAASKAAAAITSVSTGTMLMGIGTGLSTVATIQGAMAAKDASEFNARQMEVQGEYGRQLGAIDAISIAERFRKFEGQLVGDVVARGGQVDGNTALLFAEEAAKSAKLDQLNAVVDAENRARGLSNQAQATRFEGSAMRRQGIYGGLGRAMSGFSKIYEMGA